MEIINLALPGCILLKLDYFSDDRGVFVKTFNRELFKETGLFKFQMEEEFFTISHKNVIRGLHFQKPPFDHNKIVSCISGSIHDVLLDLRSSSPTFGKTCQLDLDTNKKILFIPKGIAHGFLSKENNSLVNYKVDKKYSATHDMGIAWDSINFDWNTINPIISERDSSFPTFCSFKTPFK